MRNTLRQAVLQGLIRPVDYQIALFLGRLEHNHTCLPEQLLCAALVSHAVGNSHVCLPLQTIAGKTVFKTISAYKTPDLDTLRNRLLQWPATGTPDENKPLVLDSENRLYLARYFNYQQTISQDLLQRNNALEEVNADRALPLLEKLFPATGEMDWQRLAASLALFKRLVIISGGPGTGKTHTVARILALLNNFGPTSLRIGLAAPTGKAANRLHESICQAKENLDDQLRASIPENPQTLHRMLGVTKNSIDFRYNKNNPLHLDLLVLDEASMVDIPMMARLLEALPKTARLIILGDHDQLASVEAGSFFADLCGENKKFACSQNLYKQLKLYNKYLNNMECVVSPFSDSVVRLQKSYRFIKTSSIGELAEAVNTGNKEHFEKILCTRQENFTFVPLSGLNLYQWFSKTFLQLYQDISAHDNPASALQCFNRFRILCALRDGPYGINAMNKMVEEMLAHKGVIPAATDRWYRGQPVMIRCNHYGLQLFNGDTGILWPDEDNILLAWFSRGDGSLFPVAPSRLPDHETAYAVTIHKSQGSEFQEVLLVLPPEDHQIITKELLYTGITRAKTNLTILADNAALQDSIQKRVTRHSGLDAALWNF